MEENILWFTTHRAIGALAVVGGLLLAVGIVSFLGAFNREEPTIEIISSTQDQEEAKEIVVDVSGAVERPGVYRLPLQSRVQDALISAGGLAPEADRDYLEKSVNLARNLTDGIKIYIPRRGEVVDETRALGVSSPGEEVAGFAEQGTVNINSATAAELDRLWGVGEKRAAAIIAGRPYTSVDDLVERQIVPRNVFERIRSQIAVD